MATIASALRDVVVEEWALPGHEGRDPKRKLYVATELYDWVDATESLYVEDWGARTGGRSRFEHMEQMFCDFRCDEHPLVGDLNRIVPHTKGVWKMHCPGLRVFGWALPSSAFLAVNAAFVEDTHGTDSVINERVAAVLHFAGRHGLEETILTGDRHALFR